MTAPLCIDLFCGLGGWTEGFLAEGFDVVGFDVEQHVYGEHRYPAQLVIQDVLTLHGSQFRDAAMIVASPPCQEFSYMAMPWTRAKEKAAKLRAGPAADRAKLTALFDACFRIQREACIAAGRHIPLVVENVCGAQKWVGRAKWHYGSYYLWGDVPALMPMTGSRNAMFHGVAHRSNGETNFHASATRAIASSPDFVKIGGLDWNNFKKTGEVSQFNVAAERATKNAGGSWFSVAHNTTSGVNRIPVHAGCKEPSKPLVDGPDGLKTIGHVNRRDGHSHTRHLTNQAESDALKVPSFAGPAWFDETGRTSSKSTARKAASARIAKIPLALAQHIAHVYHPFRQSVA